jgi:hypothetical protein
MEGRKARVGWFDLFCHHVWDPLIYAFRKSSIGGGSQDVIYKVRSHPLLPTVTFILKISGHHRNIQPRGCDSSRIARICVRNLYSR